MPGSARRALAATTLFLALVSAQQCFFPDGKTVSTTHVPCDKSIPATSCCADAAFCLTNGLCISDGMVTRGSCTDKNWKSPKCPNYCMTVNQDRGIPVVPCTDNGASTVFACGANNTDCQTGKNTFTMIDGSGLVLRPTQIADLVGQQISATVTSLGTVTVTASPDGDHLYTAGQMIGVAMGLLIPLLAALAAAAILWDKQRRANGHPMLKIPDTPAIHYSDSRGSRPPMTQTEHRSPYSGPPSPSELASPELTSPPVGYQGSRVGSIGTSGRDSMESRDGDPARRVAAAVNFQQVSRDSLGSRGTDGQTWISRDSSRSQPQNTSPRPAQVQSFEERFEAMRTPTALLELQMRQVNERSDALKKESGTQDYQRSAAQKYPRQGHGYEPMRVHHELEGSTTPDKDWRHDLGARQRSPGPYG